MSDDPTHGGYAPTDLVYVDPETRTVISRVEWTTADHPKSLSRKEEQAIKGRERKHVQKKAYPFGTYRSMRNAFRLEGKIREEERRAGLEEVLPKILEDLWV